MIHGEAIKGLRIEGFQSHVDTHIGFAGPGQLTVLVGDGGRGKTSVARALRWVTCNSPSGDSFINWHTNSAKVTLEMLSGFQIIRERTRGGINRYIVVAPSGERQVFEGFGTSVPEEIKRITGISEVAIGDLKLNLNMAGQLDGPFLGSTITGGQRARILGALAGTEEIDMAIRTTATDANRREQDKRRAVVGAEGAARRLEEYKHLPRMLANLQATQLLAERSESFLAKKEKAEGILSERNALIVKSAEAKRAIEGYARIEDAEKRIASARIKAADLELLSRLRSQRERYSATARAMQETLKSLGDGEAAEAALQKAKGIADETNALARVRHARNAGRSAVLVAEHDKSRFADVEKALTILQDLPGKIQATIAARSLESGRSNYAAAVADYASLATKAKDKESAVVSEYTRLLNELGVCPVCGQEIEEVCIRVS